jgi:hypothetical protein
MTAMRRIDGVDEADPGSDGSRERRYVCTRCGMKWFMPADRRLEPDPVSCSACAGPVLPLVDGANGPAASIED